MASQKRVFDLNNADDLAIVHRLLLEGTDEGDEVRPGFLSYDLEEEDCDTDASEEIEDREEDSETEQSSTDVSSEEDNEESNLYVCHRKKGKKITETFTWKKTPYSQKRKSAKHNLIKRLPGVIGKARNIDNILDIWKCLIDDDMIGIIVSYTNQHIDSIRANYSHPKLANHTDSIEIHAFIGLLYLAGHYKLGRINLEDLWDKDGFGIEIFRLTMSLFRFRFLLQTVRFDDKESRRQRREVDRLTPIRDFFEKFVKNCQACYCVGSDVTLDEKLEAFRGRCPFTQYIPSKPAKYGVKIFALVDSKMFYTINLEIYPGKQPEGPFHVSNASTDIVERMVTPIANTGRNVTADNWFSNVGLLQTLSEKYRLSYVGTLKKNKWQIPKEMKEVKNRENFSSIFAFRKEGTLVSYVPQNKQKKKNVLLISSLHMDDSIDEATGDKKKPEMITYYNEHKIGVDIVDKMCSTYNVSRGTRRWPMVVFFSVLNIAGINTQVIHIGNRNETLKRRLFLRRLGRELINDQLVRRSLTPRLPRSISARLPEITSKKQQPSIPQDNPHGTEEAGRKRCQPCWTRKTTRLTKYTCKSCRKHLCLQHCAFVCTDGCGTGVLENEEDSD